MVTTSGTQDHALAGNHRTRPLRRNLGGDLVHEHIVMLGVMMEDDEGLHPGLVAQPRPGLPGGMAPALAAGIFLVGVHGIIDDDIGTADQLEDILVETRSAERRVGKECGSTGGYRWSTYI